VIRWVALAPPLLHCTPTMSGISGKSDERDDPLRSGGIIDLLVFLMWAAVIVFGLSEL